MLQTITPAAAAEEEWRRRLIGSGRIGHTNHCTQSALNTDFHQIVSALKQSRRVDAVKMHAAIGKRRNVNKMQAVRPFQTPALCSSHKQRLELTSTDRPQPIALYIRHGVVTADFSTNKMPLVVYNLVTGRQPTSERA